MNFSLYIAKRYLRSKSTNNAINFITNIALTGVILGAASLLIVLSGFAGLKEFTLEFSSIIDPDLKAESRIGKSFILKEDEISKLKNIKEISIYSKIIQERVVIRSNQKNYLAVIKGVDKYFKNVVNIRSKIDQGNWLSQKSNEVVVGWGISNNLSIGFLDFSKPLSIYVPKPGKGQITLTKNSFNTVNAINVGVFYINEELNDSYVYAPISLTEKLLNYKKNQISAIEFKLKKGVNENTAKEKIQSVLGDKVVIKNRVQLNDALYKMLNVENLFVYFFLTLVSFLLIFNLIGAIRMMILEKKQALNVLFNTGVTIKNIQEIFFFQGSLITVFGTFIGLLLGILIIGIQKTFSLVMITSTLAYPMEIKLENVFLVFTTISVLGILASKIASALIKKNLITSA